MPRMQSAYANLMTRQKLRSWPSRVGTGTMTEGVHMAVEVARRPAPAAAAAGVLLVGAAVAVSLGVYAHAHTPAGRPISTLGFSGMLQMKAWLTTAALAFLVVQLVTALWMWGRLPGAGSAPAAPASSYTAWRAVRSTAPTLQRCSDCE
jgi:hypothetical protein